MNFPYFTTIVFNIYCNNYPAMIILVRRPPVIYYYLFLVVLFGNSVEPLKFKKLFIDFELIPHGSSL